MKKRKVIKIREPGTKRTCACCKHEKDESEFAFIKCRGAYDAYCHDCRNAYYREYNSRYKQVRKEATMGEYNINPDFKEYVDKFARDHNITPEQAVQHKIVQNVMEEYRHKRINCRR